MLSLEYRREMANLIRLYKLGVGSSDINLTIDTCSHACKATKSSLHAGPNIYQVKFAKQDYLKNSYFFRVTVLWNNLQTLDTFKTTLYKFYKLQYVASVGNNIRKQQKFYSLPKRYKQIRRFEQRPFVGY